MNTPWAQACRMCVVPFTANGDRLALASFREALSEFLPQLPALFSLPYNSVRGVGYVLFYHSVDFNNSLYSFSQINLLCSIYLCFGRSARQIVDVIHVIKRATYIDFVVLRGVWYFFSDQSAPVTIVVVEFTVRKTERQHEFVGVFSDGPCLDVLIRNGDRLIEIGERLPQTGKLFFRLFPRRVYKLNPSRKPHLLDLAANPTQGEPTSGNGRAGADDGSQERAVPPISYREKSAGEGARSCTDKDSLEPRDRSFHRRTLPALAQVVERARP